MRIQFIAALALIQCGDACRLSPASAQAGRDRRLRVFAGPRYRHPAGDADWDLCLNISFQFPK